MEQATPKERRSKGAEEKEEATQRSINTAAARIRPVARIMTMMAAGSVTTSFNYLRKNAGDRLREAMAFASAGGGSHRKNKRSGDQQEEEESEAVKEARRTQEDDPPNRSRQAVGSRAGS